MGKSYEQLNSRKSTKKNEEQVEKYQPILYYSAGLTLFKFSLAMLIVPFGLYFIVNHLTHGSTTAAAFGAIAGVQIVLAAYIYEALQECHLI